MIYVTQMFQIAITYVIANQDFITGNIKLNIILLAMKMKTCFIILFLIKQCYYVSLRKHMTIQTTKYWKLNTVAA